MTSKYLTHAELVAQGVPRTSPMMRMIADMERLSAFEHSLVPFDGWDDAAQPVKPTRKRMPTAASMMRQVQRAGFEVAGYKRERDGSITVITGKPITDADTERNEWDTVQ